MWRIERIISKGAYNYAVVLNHPNATKHGYVLEHRIVMENYIGRILTKDEVVHHKNENKKDNRLCNLELMNDSEHRRQHSTTGRTMIILECPNCKVEFERERRTTHFVKGGKNTFCSRKCNGEYYASVA